MPDGPLTYIKNPDTAGRQIKSTALRSGCRIPKNTSTAVCLQLTRGRLEPPFVIAPAASGNVLQMCCPAAEMSPSDGHHIHLRSLLAASISNRSDKCS